MLQRLWKRVVWAGASGIESHALRIRIAMTNQVAVAVVGCVSLLAGAYTVTGLRHVPAYIGPILVALLAVPVLNYLRRRNSARMLLLICIVAVIYVGVSVVGPRSGIQHFLYPAMLIPVVLFHRRETMRMWTGILITIFANVLLGFELYLPTPYSDPPPLWLLDGNRALALSGSLALLVYTFWQNHVQLMGLVFRNLEKEKARTEALIKKDEQLVQYAADLERSNQEHDRIENELRLHKDLLEDQATELRLSQHELTQTVTDLSKQRQELEQNRFFDRGSARMAEIMRWDDSLDQEAWTDRVLRELVLYIGAAQGAFHLVEGEGETATLWLAGAFGVGELSALHRRSALDSSLPGQVALTRRAIRLTGLDALAGRVRPLATSAGALQPSDLLLVPLVYQNQLEGVLEIVGATPLSSTATDFVHRLAPTIAANLITLKNQQRIFDLLHQKDAYADQLVEREQQLHKNIEKLVSANHDLKFIERKLRQAQQEMQQLNLGLSEKVSQREGELSKAREQIRHLERDLKQSERLLLAGSYTEPMTAELGQSLGAIKAASDSLITQLPRLAEGLARLSSGIDQKQRMAFYGLASVVLTQSLSAPPGSERVRRRQLSQRLTEAGMRDADEVARRLVEAGLDGEVSPYLGLLTSPAGPLAVDMITAAAQLRLNLTAILRVVERERQAVLALGNLLHLRTDVAEVDLRECIANALALHRTELKGLEVANHLDDVGCLTTSPLQLQNAVIAVLKSAVGHLHRRGRISISLRREADEAVWQLSDALPSGPSESGARARKPAAASPNGSPVVSESLYAQVAAVGGELRVIASADSIEYDLRWPLGVRVAPEVIKQPNARTAAAQ